MWSFLMSFLMVLSSLFGYVPTITYAAGVTLKAGSITDKIDAEYAATFKITKNTKVSLQGASNSSSLNKTINPGREDRQENGFAVDLSKTEKGFSVLYSDIGEINGKTADLKVTFTNWDTPKKWYYYDPGNGYPSVDPVIYIKKKKIDFAISGIEWANMRYEFLEHGTDKALSTMVGGHFTAIDIDDGQYIYFPSDANVKEARYLKNGILTPSGGDTLKSPDNTLTTDDDLESWVSGLFDGTSVKIRFGDGGEAYSGSNTALHGEIVRRFSNSETRDYLMLPHYVFTSEVIGYFVPDDYNSVEKRISDTGVSYNDAMTHKQATKNSPYLIAGEGDAAGTGKFTYHVGAILVPNQYENFIISDPINEALVIDSVKVYDMDTKEDVSDAFTITTTNNNAKAVAKESSLKDSDFYNNKLYVMQVIVHRESGKELPVREGDMNLVSNTGHVRYSIKNVSGDFVYASLPVWAGYQDEKLPPEPGTLSKRVGEKGIDWESAQECDSEDMAYQIQGYNSYDYLIQAEVNSNGQKMKNFTITDTLEECIDIDNQSKVTITNKAGDVVDSNFDIKVSEDTKGAKTVTVTATAEALANEKLWTSEAYTVRMNVHRKKTTDVATSMKKWMDEDGYTFYVPNEATLQMQSVIEDSQQKLTSNESWVTDAIGSELKIEKNCIPYDDWEVGDEVEYKVRVTQTKQDSYAVNVEAWDNDLPDGLKLVAGSIKISDSRLSDGAIANVEPDGSNGWKATCPRMQYNDYFVVSFKAKADETVNGKDTINTAYASAENMDGEISDSAEAWVNSPEFTIDKYMDKYEHEVGDTVKYTVVVSNTKDYTVAKNVVVSDLSIPEGMKLNEGEDSIKVSFSPDQEKDSVGWPVADGTEAIQTQPRENKVSIEQDGNGWIVKSKYLSSDAVMTIEFECTATEEINGCEVQNKASVTADNALKDKDGKPSVVWDDAKVYTNTADLSIDKKASAYEWQMGDIVDYTIEISNEDSVEGTIARNVVVKDIEIPAGLNLESLEDVRVSGIPAMITDKVQGPNDKSSQLDEKEYNSTEEKTNNYDLKQEGDGFTLTIPNLPQGEKVSITFSCTALSVAEGEDGWEWINKAKVDADNQRGHEPKEDDAEIYINTAKLNLDKSMKNSYYQPDADDYDNREANEFRVGEDVEYTVTLDNVQRNSVARNVLVKDLTIPDGYTLGEVTVTGFKEKWNNPVAGTEDAASQLDPDYYRETEEKDFSYEIKKEEDGFTVSIENLPCTTGDTLNPDWTTPITIIYHCTPTEKVNGWQIVNTASVSSDNALEKKDSETIWVNSPVLQTEKKSDRTDYKIGDVITYEISAIQSQPGCVARNVTIADVLLTEGVKLQKDSIVLMDEKGTVIDLDDYDVEIDNSHFTIKTKRALISNASNYPVSDMDKEKEVTDGGAYNPLNITKESKLQVEYQAVAVDESLLGKTVQNKVTVNSDENIPAEAEHEVPIHAPSLNIEKTSDKEIYHVGDTGIYKLVVTQLREDVKALDVQITDTLQTEGAKIVEDSLIMEFNNKEFEPVKVEVTDSGFSIDTGKDLSDEDKIEIVYQVLFESPSLDGKKVKNLATAQGSNTPKEEQKNVVKVEDLNPSLAIKKTSDKESYKVGEIGHYTVVITETEKDSVARNVIVKDQLETEGAKIVDGSIVIKNDAGRVLDDAEIQYSGSTYAIYTGKDLEYKENFTITYDVLFESETLAGEEITNIARVTCDNIKVEVDDPKPVTLPNGLVVLKSSDPKNGSLVKKGDDIQYTIKVSNPTNTDMTNVLIKDEIPEYMQYKSSEEQEGVTAGTRSLNEKLYATFIIGSLPAGEEKEVSFTASVIDTAPEDGMLVNVAQVRTTKFVPEDMTDDTWNHEGFRNTNETVHYLDTRWVKDVNVVTIESGKLAIEKVSDKLNYSVGEVGHYTVTVSQKVDGAVSRNVAITDHIYDDKAIVQTETIKVYLTKAGEENRMELEDISVTVGSGSFQVLTNTNLLYGDKLELCYDVLFEDASLEGKQIKNVASVKDNSTPEGEEPQDDNRVTVGDADLIIAKNSDKTAYKVGDVGNYELKITCADPDRTIENIVVKDVVKQTGAHLVTGTVRVYYDNEELKVNVQEKDNEFVVETGKDLSGTHAIYVRYDVVFEDASLNGKDVDNVATTWGDNTNPTDDTHTVHVGEGTPDTPNPSEPDEPAKPSVGLTIMKTANKQEVSVGDTVSYTLEAVTNSDTESAKSVMITDTLDPEYFTYLSIDKDSVRSYLDNTEFHGKSVNITENGFTLETGKDLAPGQVLKVTYNVLMKDESLKGKDVKNTAVVSADNADTAKDDETVSIKDVSPGLKIVKSTSNPKVNAGDKVSYTLDVRTSSKETVKAVVVKDQLSSEKMKIDESSVRAELDGERFTPAKLEVNKNQFTMETGKDLKAGEILKITYDVQTASDEDASEITNIASVQGENADPVKDTAKIELNVKEEGKPALSITKTVNTTQAEVGDTVLYVLSVKQTEKNQTAKNVVISDKLNQTGVKISDIKVTLDGKIVDAVVNAGNSGFTVDTKTDLPYGSEMKVSYKVLFKDSSLKGKTVANTAVASADDVKEVSASADIDIPADKATATVTPTPTPTAKAEASEGKSADAAKTGDTRPIKMVVMIAVVAAAGLAGGIYLSKKGKKRKL